MKKKLEGYLVAIGVIVFFAIINFMFINIGSVNFELSPLHEQNSFSEKNGFLQIQELPDSYIKILTSINFILLMIICFLCLSVPITILIHFIIQKRLKNNEEKFPWVKKDFKIKDERTKALDFIQMDSINLIKYGFYIFLLLPVIEGIFIAIAFPALSHSLFPGDPIPFGYIFFLFLFAIIIFVFEIIAGLLIGIGFIKLSKEDTQKKYLVTLGIFWLIWLIFSPFLKLTLFIGIAMESLTENGLISSIYFWFNNPAISFAFVILFVLRLIITSLVLYFSAIILQEKELIKTKGLLVASSIIIWFISSGIHILSLVFDTVPFREGTLFYGLQMLVGSFFFAYMIISPMVAIITTIFFVKEFKIKQKKEKEILIRSKHDILSLSDIFTNKSIFFQDISLVKKLNFLSQIESTEFSEDIHRNFTSRLDGHIFIVFMDIEKRSLPKFLVDFVKMNKVLSEINTLFYTKISSKKQPFLSIIKWEASTDFESIIEFNFDKLPCIFILDKLGNELGKIEGKLEHEQTLVEELIFHLDVGLFI